MPFSKRPLTRQKNSVTRMADRWFGSKKKHKHEFRNDTLLFVFGMIMLGVFFFQTQPRFGDVRYSTDGGVISSQLPSPLTLQTESPEVTFTIPLSFVDLKPQLFTFEPQGCIRSIMIEGQSVYAGTEPCEFSSSRTLLLGPHLKTGRNEFVVHMQRTGEKIGLDLHTATHDPLTVVTLIAMLFLVCWYSWTASRFLPVLNGRRWIIILFVIGIIARSGYTMWTPPDARAHDQGAHMEYIHYVAQNKKMPPAQDGWEFHQPPLYYFLAAGIMNLETSFGRSAGNAERDLQALSVLFSVIALGAGLFIGLTVFTVKKWLPMFVYSLMLTGFPVLIYSSSRITNESLSHPLTVLTLLMTILFWQTGKLKFWHATWVLLGLTFITKVSALTLFPVALVSLFHPKMIQKMMHIKSSLPKRSKKFLGGIFIWAKPLALPLLIAGLLFFLIAGWYPIARLQEADTTKTFTAGNEGMSGDLRVPRGIANLITFHPAQILSHPFNDPWNDEQRRQFFPEYFFKSAFFGEYLFRGLETFGRTILLGSILLLPLLVGGLWMAFTRYLKPSVPLLMTFISVFGAAVVYRVLFAYSSNQDFRFSVLLLIPLAYFLGLGMSTRSAFRRIFAATYMGILACLWVGFVMTVAVGKY